MMGKSIEKTDLLTGVEVRHLVALDAIARTRSFSQAAAELGYAQSAVSQQIATLERSVGHKLVERPGGPRPVSLTEAGELVLRHANHITARLGAVRADLDALAAGEAGSVRIGTFQSASAKLLPPTLTRFRDTWPRVGVELRNELNTSTLDDLVRAGQLDLAFSDIEPTETTLAYESLVVDEYVLVVPPWSPLVEQPSVDLRELDDLDLISGSLTNDTCGLRIAKQLEVARVRPRVVFRSDDNLTTQRLVASGLGLAIMPLLAVERFVPDAEVAVLPLNDETAFHRTIGIVWHPDRYRSRAAEAFVETAREVADRLSVPAVPATTGSH
jgi:DNA-binding transcriptional LysR family regulator